MTDIFSSFVLVLAIVFLLLNHFYGEVIIAQTCRAREKIIRGGEKQK